MKTEDIIVGCSSFNEGYWKGIFYPENLPRKDWFTFYCRHFNTYELNATFYKFPTEKSLTTWYNKAPEGFLISVKMYKGITHYKKFKDCEKQIEEFYNVCRDNLKEKLCCVLFQLPPSFHYSDENLHKILNAVDDTFSNVVEFRHQSWWREEVYQSLRERNITFCNVSYPNLPKDVVATTNIGYVRFHGVPKLFYSGYSDEDLKNKHEQIQKQKWQKAFVYFNNTASAQGILNALDFKNPR